MPVTISISNDKAYGFKPVTVMFNKLHEYTAKYNYSAGVYTNQHRDKDNLSEFSSILIYDFDDGKLSICELKEFLERNKITSLILTSKSHMIAKNDKPACERYRLIIYLSERIMISKEDYSDFYIYVASVLNIDKYIDSACKDAPRFFWANAKQEHWYVLTNRAPSAHALIKNFYAYKKQKNKEDKKNHQPLLNLPNLAKTSNPDNDARQGAAFKKSKNKELKSNELPPSHSFELKGGEIKLFNDFEYLAVDETVIVRCPSGTHEDRNPSAFITRAKNQNQNLIVICKACGYKAFMGESNV